jgi:hypothetical protein
MVLHVYNIVFMCPFFTHMYVYIRGLSIHSTHVRTATHEPPFRSAK